MNFEFRLQIRMKPLGYSSSITISPLLKQDSQDIQENYIALVKFSDRSVLNSKRDWEMNKQRKTGSILYLSSGLEWLATFSRQHFFSFLSLFDSILVFISVDILSINQLCIICFCLTHPSLHVVKSTVNRITTD